MKNCQKHMKIPFFEQKCTFWGKDLHESQANHWQCSFLKSDDSDLLTCLQFKWWQEQFDHGCSLQRERIAHSKLTDFCERVKSKWAKEKISNPCQKWLNNNVYALYVDTGGACPCSRPSSEWLPIPGAYRWPGWSMLFQSLSAPSTTPSIREVWV